MTVYFIEGGDKSIVSFESDPQRDANADAKSWHPANGDWVDVPGSSSIAADVVWSGDYYPIPEDQVEEFQRRCTASFNAFKARRAQ